jgi:hypothetical protein
MHVKLNIIYKLHCIYRSSGPEEATREHEAYSAAANIDVQENETQTPVSISLGNIDQLLRTHLFFDTNGIFFIYFEGGKGKGYIMHRLEKQILKQ